MPAEIAINQGASMDHSELKVAVVTGIRLARRHLCVSAERQSDEDRRKAV
jgi:hypothetical protein